MAQTKTPISLMNELCKANSVVAEYKVVEETGPPHQKSFRVELNLVNLGSYEGIAQTIKGAKHKAAQLGLETSGLTKPERRPKLTSVVASVELNSLAMKLGKMVEYHDLPSNQHSGPTPVPSNAYTQYGSQLKPYSPGLQSYGHAPTKACVSLKIGEKEYFGEGYRRKDARHSAAVEALADLRKELGIEVNMEKEASEDPGSATKTEISSETHLQGVENDQSQCLANPIKSEISQVYEIASKQKLKIDFDVVSSSGPPHNRTFVTSVTVGEFTAVGEGPGKKASKQAASVKILDELKKLPPVLNRVPPSSRPKGRLYNHGGYGKKTPKELDSSLNPISLLGQLRQRRKEMLPVYTLIAEEGIRNKEFTMQVQVDSHTARGSGANKKEAKKNAAEAMLKLLGIRSSSPTSPGENDSSEAQDKNQNYVGLTIELCSDEAVSESSEGQTSSMYGCIEVGHLSKNDLMNNQFFDKFLRDGSSEGNNAGSESCKEVRKKSSGIKKIHCYSLFEGQKPNQRDEKTIDKGNASEGRQLPPGLLPILPEMTNRRIPAVPPPLPQAKPLSNLAQQVGPTVTVLNRAPGAPVGKPLSEEILHNGSTPSMKKLQQLAETGGFQVQYQDTTQENNEQCLAVVSMTTVPPLICRGFGPNLELAFENAAANALVPLLQPPGPQNGPMIDHHNSDQCNHHIPSEDPSGGKSMV